MITDNLAKGANQNSQVEKIVVPIDAGTNFKGNATFFKCGNIVTCTIIVENASGFNVSSGVTLLKLPEGCIPKSDMLFPILARNTGAWASADYHAFLACPLANGNLIIRGKTEILTNDQYLLSSFTYVAG